MVLILKLDALPTMYLAVVVGILIFLLFFIFMIMKPSKKVGKGKTREAIGKIISLLLSIVLIVGTVYIGQGNQVLGSITGANQQINRFNVYVLASSEIDDLKDLTYEDVGMSKVYDKEEHCLEAHNGVFEEIYKSISNDLKVIYTHEIVEEIVDISKNVNVTKDVFTIYISGIDTTGNVSTVSRSDVNM